MFTLEINGKPIAITDAEEAQARGIFQSEEFGQDLMAMTTGGKPLWDGHAPLVIRPGSEQEVEAFEAPEFDVDDDDEEDDGGVFVTFLVPIDHDHEERADIPPELQS